LTESIDVGDEMNKINIDIEEYHGLAKLQKGDVINPYEIDRTAYEYFDLKVKLGISGVILCLLNIGISLFVLWYLFFLENGWRSEVDHIAVKSLMTFAFIQLSAYSGLLFRFNWARMVVLCLSYMKLIAFPIGTIEGMLFIRKLKNRVF
jgi:hypothetical protein